MLNAAIASKPPVAPIKSTKPTETKAAEASAEANGPLVKEEKTEIPKKDEKTETAKKEENNQAFEKKDQNPK